MACLNRKFHLRTWLCGVVLACTTTSLARATTYYVSPSGSDRAAGSTIAPWKTINYAAGRAHAGDTVVVKAGVYRESVIVKRGGSASAPLTVRGLAGAALESPNGNLSLSAFDFNAGVAFVRLQNFELRGGFDETVFLRAGAHDIELASLIIHDNHTGIWVGGAYRVVIRDSFLHHNFRTGVRIFAGAP
ncbi:MAG TPA: hypothetical protein VL403_02230 [Candidatus Kryptonia bacterium]|nr:hypothetical protein [Candidatus Kryptonia bacterium]